MQGILSKYVTVRNCDLSEELITSLLDINVISKELIKKIHENTVVIMLKQGRNLAAAEFIYRGKYGREKNTTKK